MVAARLGGIIGNIVIATLLDMYCPAPTFIVAGLLIGKNHITYTHLVLERYAHFVNFLS
jgi:hypothetical protein